MYFECEACKKQVTSFIKVPSISIFIEAYGDKQIISVDSDDDYHDFCFKCIGLIR